VRTAWKAPIACAAGLLFTWGTIPHVTRPILRGEGLMDSTSFRNGAQFLGTRYLYDPAAYVNMQRREPGAQTGYRIYLRPPWYALSSLWLAYLPYKKAMVTWKALMLAAAVVFVFLWPERRAAALALCWGYPLPASLEQGQDVTLVLSGLALAGTLAHDRKDYLAGLALAFCSIKPNLLVMAPIALVSAKRPRIATGLVAGLGILSAVSFGIQGSTWPADFIRILATPDMYNKFPQSPSLAYLFPHSTETFKAIASLALAFAMLPFIVQIGRRDGVVPAIYAAVAAAVVTSPHAYLQDVLLVMPFTLLVAVSGQSDWIRRIAWFVLCPASTFPLANRIPSIGALAIAVPVLALIIWHCRPIPRGSGPTRE
jgi:hypothetical protein